MRDFSHISEGFLGVFLVLRSYVIVQVDWARVLDINRAIFTTNLWQRRGNERDSKFSQVGIFGRPPEAPGTFLFLTNTRLGPQSVDSSYKSPEISRTEVCRL